MVVTTPNGTALTGAVSCTGVSLTALALDISESIEANGSGNLFVHPHPVYGGGGGFVFTSGGGHAQGLECDTNFTFICGLFAAGEYDSTTATWNKSIEPGAGVAAFVMSSAATLGEINGLQWSSSVPASPVYKFISSSYLEITSPARQLSPVHIHGDQYAWGKAAYMETTSAWFPSISLTSPISTQSLTANGQTIAIAINSSIPYSLYGVVPLTSTASVTGIVLPAASTYSVGGDPNIEIFNVNSVASGYSIALAPANTASSSGYAIAPQTKLSCRWLATLTTPPWYCQ
jgi:hypothetical protein